MCGLVAILNPSAVAHKSEERYALSYKSVTEVDDVFQTALGNSLHRGRHSTGVMTWGTAQWSTKVSTTTGTSFDWYKKTGAFTTLLSLHKDVSNGVRKSIITAGHVRHATSGAAGEIGGAHPHQCGDVILMHNGSLAYGWKDEFKGDKDAPATDSIGIAKTINEKGAKHTFETFVGAKTCFWFDVKEQTFNIYKSVGRPLWEVKAKCGFTVVASELSIALKALDVNGFDFTSYKEFENERHYKYDANTCELLSVEEYKEKPVPTVVDDWGFGNWGRRSYAYTRPVDLAYTSTTKLLRHSEVKRGDIIVVKPYGKVDTSKNYVKLFGYFESNSALTKHLKQEFPLEVYMYACNAHISNLLVGGGGLSFAAQVVGMARVEGSKSDTYSEAFCINPGVVLPTVDWQEICDENAYDEYVDKVETLFLHFKTNHSSLMDMKLSTGYSPRMYYESLLWYLELFKVGGTDMPFKFSVGCWYPVQKGDMILPIPTPMEGV